MHIQTYENIFGFTFVGYNVKIPSNKKSLPLEHNDNNHNNTIIMQVVRWKAT